ncbi:MAG: pentapeptide repeat-containing protein [Pyrinomonadaceae bacterium]
MAEPNPHRQGARVLAFTCYIIAGFVLVVGAFFTLGAALTELPQPAHGHITNERMVVMTASMFTVIALLIALFGWRVQSLFGQPKRQEKLVAKSAVGCLRLSSLGCGLWTAPSTLTVLITGRLPFGEPAGLKEICVALSGFALIIALMLAVAWFISTNVVRPNPAEARRAFQSYLNLVQPRLPAMADPETRAYVQEQTMDVLTKLDTTFKSILLDFLSKSELLSGPTRVVLQDADFRGVDLRSADLPRADLSGINLEQSQLQGAGLFEANLSRGCLKSCQLTL